MNCKGWVAFIGLYYMTCGLFLAWCGPQGLTSWTIPDLQCRILFIERIFIRNISVILRAVFISAGRLGYCICNVVLVCFEL